MNYVNFIQGFIVFLGIPVGYSIIQVLKGDKSFFLPLTMLVICVLSLIWFGLYMPERDIQ